MRKWITKKEITKILNTYSVRKDEFEQVGGQEYFYQSQLVKGYTITLSEDRQEGKDISIKTGRILVSHSRTNGKKTFHDIWERDENNNLQFCFRNPWDKPFSDIEAIRDLEEQNRQLLQAGRELQEQLKQRDSHKLNNETDRQEELNMLREQVASLEKEIQNLKSDTRHNARGAGRKPSQERLNMVEQVRVLLNSGKSDIEIQKALNISKSTFYRYKKSISN